MSRPSPEGIPSLEDIQAAAERIKEAVRRTPLLRTRHLRNPIHPGLKVKLECLQVTGAFKARGASNAILSLPDDALAKGVVTASGGNHGEALAYAAWAKGCAATIYLPESAPPHKAERVRAWNGEAIVIGKGWDEANHAALERAERDDLAYVHAFGDSAVIAGQGTVALEILKQDSACSTMIVPIGGGGLMAGMALAAKALKPDIRLIGVEPTGAPTLKESLAADQVITLPEIASQAGTLSPRRSEEINFEVIRRHVDDIVLVSDAEMREAAQWLWFEMGIASELSGAAALAAVMTGRATCPDDQAMAAIISGAGSDGLG
ncbi:MAG: threonine/serine dehydratase [Pseudomonadota bacterium]